MMINDIFQNAGWKCCELLERMSDADDFYFDIVSQIIMERWSSGRVTLLGVACQSVSMVLEDY